MEPAPPEKILQAFKILDPENKGYLTKESFGKLMMEESMDPLELGAGSESNWP